jgi:TPR repeat protein
VLKDYKQAVYWYQKAADQGDAKAQSNLGIMYAFGKGVLKDYNTPLPFAYITPRID